MSSLFAPSAVETSQFVEYNFQALFIILGNILLGYIRQSYRFECAINLEDRWPIEQYNVVGNLELFACMKHAQTFSGFAYDECT